MHVNPTQVSNHETWLAASWIFSDEVQASKWLDVCAQIIRPNPHVAEEPDEYLSNLMAEHYTRMIDAEVRGAGMLHDLLMVSYQKVQWLEVAQLAIDTYNSSH